MTFKVGDEVVVLDGSEDHGERGKILLGPVEKSTGQRVYYVRLYDDGTVHPCIEPEIRPLLGAS